jgi:hypothetical protein
MSIFYKLLILAMIVATSGLFFIKSPQGKPFLSYKDFIPDISKHIAQAKEIAEKVPVGQKQIAEDSAQAAPPTLKKNNFYKWKDAYGSWQFTQEPPPQKDAEFSVISVDPKANIIKSMSKKEINKALKGHDEEPEKLAGKGAAQLGEEELNAVPGLTTVPVTKIPQMIDAAKQIQTLSNQRSQSMEAL